jgi:hypothetical protein
MQRARHSKRKNAACSALEADKNFHLELSDERKIKQNDRPKNIRNKKTRSHKSKVKKR